jgi:hypothetical protein
MAVNVTPRQRREAWHIDHINKAPDAEQAVTRTVEWVKAELKLADDQRHDDADGFRWQLVETLARFAKSVPGRHPEDRFRNLGGQRPMLPGGGWTPAPAHGTYPQAREP